MKLILFAVLLFFAAFAYLVVKVTNEQIADLRSHGASANTVEAETGLLAGSVQKVTTPDASGGMYVLFGGSTQPTTPPTSTPVITRTSAIYPAQILNLTNWKETLPTGSSGSPTEILQPTLATFSINPWFIVSPDGNGVQFRAPVNGVTTSNSGYPRSELREMTNSGKTLASWSSTSGTHTMTIDEKITAVPKTKKHVVAGQVHDASDDVIVIRLEYPKLFIDINGSDGPTLDANYTLGKRFTVKFVVNGGKTSIYYNGSTTPAYTLSQSYSGAYFKAGAYTQSNCSTEASGDCSSSNYGEVVVYNVTVTHQ